MEDFKNLNQTSFSYENGNQSLSSNDMKSLFKKRKLVTVNDKDSLINEINNLGSSLTTITITTSLIQFTEQMRYGAAIYLYNKKVEIIGPTNKVELRGQGIIGQGRNYRIFWLDSGTYHLENLKITNGYQVIYSIYFLLCNSI